MIFVLFCLLCIIKLVEKKRIVFGRLWDIFPAECLSGLPISQQVLLCDLSQFKWSQHVALQLPSHQRFLEEYCWKSLAEFTNRQRHFYTNWCTIFIFQKA